MPAVCLAALAAQAQDYVETTAGDTLRGRIQLGSGPAGQLRLYRPGAAPAAFTARQARSYGNGRTLLKTTRPVGRVDGAPRFLAPLVRGGVSLYAGQNDAGQVRYYLQPADSAYVVEVPPERPLLTYARLLSNCPSLEIGSDQFATRYRYTSSGLTRLVTDYNRCRQQPTEVVRTPTGLRTSLGLQVGFNTSSFRFGTDNYSRQVYQNDHTASLGYQAGLVLVLRTRSSFGVQLEGTYVHLSSDYGPSIPTNTGTYFGLYGVKLRYSQAQLAGLLRYTIGRGSLAPYLLLGPNIGVNFNDNSRKVIYTGVYTGTGSGTVSGEEPFGAGTNASTLSLGGSGGIGLTVRGAGLPAIQLQGRYDYQYDNSTYGLTHSAWRLEAGVLF